MDFDTQPFFRDGFQIFRGLVALDRVAVVKQRLETRLNSALDLMRPLGVRPEVAHAGGDIRALLAAPNAQSIDMDLRVTMTGSFPLDVRLDPVLLEIPHDENLQRVLKSALNTSHLRMHMPPMARFIFPGNFDAGVPPHQDVSYNHHMSNFLTLWTPLVEIDEACGGVTVFRASDRTEFSTQLSALGVWNEGLDTEGLEPVNCTPMSPGDVLIFNKLLIHRSMPNLSDRIRFSMDYRFFGDQDSSSKHYLDMSTGQVIAPNETGRASSDE